MRPLHLCCGSVACVLCPEGKYSPAASAAPVAGPVYFLDDTGERERKERERESKGLLREREVCERGRVYFLDDTGESEGK